jgi:centractin
MEDRTQNRPVVIDNGTGVMKAGFAGSDKPKSVFPSYVGRPKHSKIMVQSKIEGDTFVGHDAEEHRGIMKLEYPMRHGIVENWSDMEKIWSYVYGKSHLGVNSEDHPVLLTEAPLNPRYVKFCMTLIFFIFNNKLLNRRFKYILILYFILIYCINVTGPIVKQVQKFFLRHLVYQHYLFHHKQHLVCMHLAEQQVLYLILVMV